MRFLTCCLLIAAPLLRAAAPAPPEPKEVLRLLMSSHDVRLTVDRTCHEVGTDLEDKDIGAYIAGFLAEGFTQKEGSYRIDITSEPSDRTGAWLCTVYLTRRYEEECWAWGVSFLVRKKDRKVIRSSFRCLGAG